MRTLAQPRPNSSCFQIWRNNKLHPGQNRCCSSASLVNHKHHEAFPQYKRSSGSVLPNTFAAIQCILPARQECKITIQMPCGKCRQSYSTTTVMTTCLRLSLPLAGLASPDTTVARTKEPARTDASTGDYLYMPPQTNLPKTVLPV